MKYKPYRGYKPSGVEWLHEVPTDWELRKIRYCADLNPSKAEAAGLPRDMEVSFIPMEAIGDDGTIVLDRTKPIGEAESGYTYFRENDITIAKITPCFENGKGALMTGLVNGLGFGTTELIVVRAKEDTDPRFLQWLFRSSVFRKIGEGFMYGAGGQKRVPDDFVRDFPMACPSVSEQRAISVFLDRETAKIDTLIAKQEKLIELLKEKRQAVISHAVTKGLDPTVRMKPSGVEWLGNVPSHWSVVKSRRYFSQRKDRALEGDRQLTASQKYGVIYQEDYMALENSRVMQVITGSEILKHIEPNDFVISMRSFQGGLEWSSLRGSVSSAYVALIPSNEVHGTFFSFLFKSQPYIQALQSTSNLVRDGQALRYDNFVQVDLPLPPIDEQAAIAKFIKTEVEKIDRLALKAKQAIALQKEHRVALISAVVTGKLDVRDAAVDLQEAA